MIMSSRDLLCVVLEILRLILIVTVCIVLAALIELHPVSALHDADSGQTSAQVPQWASKQSDKYRTLLHWVLTKLLAHRNIGINTILVHLCFYTTESAATQRLIIRLIIVHDFLPFHFR